MTMSWLTTPGMTQSFARLDEENLNNDSFYDPDCDYDWPTLSEKVILCIVYGLLGLTGFVGNFLVVYTIFFKKGPQSVTSMLLCSLAMSDIIVVTIYLPLKLTDWVTDSWVLGAIPCKLIAYMNLVSPSCSACMLMVIGLERFIVILYPLRARSLLTRVKAKFIVAGTWMVSLAIGVPGFVFQDQAEGYIGEFVCIKDYDTYTFLKKGFPIYGLVILYIIPLSVMGFAYSAVCLRLYASTKTSRGLQSMKAPSYSTSKNPRANANGFGAPNPNLVPSSVDDDPFSGPSEGRCDTAVGGPGQAVAPGGSSHAGRPRRPRRPVSLKDRQQVILMLILVVVLYAVNWGPLLVISVLNGFGALGHLCMNVLYQISAACHVWTFLNSVINPIVYSFMSRNFRKNVAEALRTACRCFCRGKRRRGGRESTYQSSRYSTTTMVTQASSMRRGRSTSDGNCSPSKGRGQNIELTQYSRVPSAEPMV